MAVLDKRTNKTAVISKMNEQDGSIEVVPPSGPGSSPFRIWMTAFSVLSKTASGTRKKLKLVGFWY